MGRPDGALPRPARRRATPLCRPRDRELGDRLEVSQRRKPREAQRVQPVARKKREVGVGGPQDPPGAVVLLIALADRLDEQRVLPLVPARARPGGSLGARPGLRRLGFSARKRGGEQPAHRANLAGERLERVHAPDASAKATCAASSVRVTCSSVCASEGNQASNWDGGGYTPRASRARHHAAWAVASHAVAPA